MRLFFAIRLILILSLVSSKAAIAQDSEDLTGENEGRATVISKPKVKTIPDSVPLPPPGGKSKNTGLPLAKDGLAPTPDQTSWWSPKGMRHSVGVELSDSSFGVLGADAVTYGFSFEKFGADFYLAYVKDANSATESVAQTSNDVSTPKTLTVTKRYSGSENPRKTTLGVQPKYIFFSDRWLKVSVGMMLAHSQKTSVRYKTGSMIMSYADSASSSNYSVTESSLGSISSSVSAKTIYGPRVNVEFYLKWFPHIALGFGTGLLLTQGGDATTSTVTQSRTYSVANGVTANPTSSQTTSSTDKVKSGGSSKTIAVGGTKFNLMGNFAIRYIW